MIVGNGSVGIASHIGKTQSLTTHISPTDELPQIMQNIIESAESYDLIQYETSTPLSGREKRRERRKQERKRK